MLTQAIPLGRLPPSGAPGGRGQRAAAALGAERPYWAAAAGDPGPRGFARTAGSGANARDNRVHRIAWELSAAASACGEAPPILWRRVRRWRRSRRRRNTR